MDRETANSPRANSVGIRIFAGFFGSMVYNITLLGIDMMSFYLDNSINFFCLANQLNKNVLYFLIYEMMAAYTNPYNFYQKNVLRMTRFSVFFVNVQTHSY